MAMKALEVSGLSYSVQPHFWSRRRALLTDVSFSVEEGEIFGFLGPNGAGKTTTIRAIIGLLRPQAGTLRLFGADPSTAAGRRRLGFLPERSYYPEHLSGRELARMHGLLAGLDLSAAKRRADELLALVGLTEACDRRLGSYSKGMLQRVGLAQALMGEPDIVILDEPMSGLDPLGRRDVREIMLELRRRGKTVFFSTHILPDVEMICDRVAIVVGGKTTRQGKLQDLVTAEAPRYEITAPQCPAELEARLVALGSSVRVRPGGVSIDAPSLEAANRAIDCLRAAAVTVVQVTAHRQSLEDLFLREAQKPAAGSGA